MAIPQQITYGQLRTVLHQMGFCETRRDEGLALKHRKSGIVFLFRAYEPADRLQPAEIFMVSQELDARGMLEPESFETLLSRTPA